ncbi:hypothetical protein Pcinc_023814 [Petrolisthes cinctipes]|uniref:Uncharacterized protein n=1 Tax=Petrolisthes cinctipes TaxID=88211 RepID=A0AAE1FBS1_PETCI|nr:hypothetical protein Pcinc_023814 [Petrolisthes cinctipes]
MDEAICCFNIFNSPLWHSVPTEHVVNKAIMGFEFTKYRGPILLGGVIATLSLAYNFRMELIGDLSQEKAILHKQTDENDVKKIRASIREYHMNHLKSSNPDK